MLLHPAQQQIANCRKRFIVFVCGRKFGKTTLEAEEIKGEAVLENDSRILYLAPTLGDARTLMWDRLHRELRPAIVSENETRLEMRVRNNRGTTSDIFLGSWEKVDNYRGDEFNLIVCDEVQLYRNFWVGWYEALRPTLTPRRGRAIFTGTSKGFNHFYDLINLGHTDPEWASFRFTTYDNPYIDANEIEDAKRQLPEDQFAQEYLAEFRKAQGLVFKEFSRQTHVFTDPIYGYTETLAGVDFGYTNPTAIPTVKVKDGSYYVTHELYKTGMTDDEVADYVAAQRFNKVYPDPEAPAAIEVMRRKGVNVRDVNKGKDSITAGIDRVRELFKQNRLFIHTSCVNLIGELETYSYADSNAERNPTEKPLNKSNHAIDALRYVVMSHTAQRPYIQRPFYDKTIDIWRNRPTR